VFQSFLDLPRPRHWLVLLFPGFMQQAQIAGGNGRLTRYKPQLMLPAWVPATA